MRSEAICDIFGMSWSVIYGHKNSKQIIAYKFLADFNIPDFNPDFNIRNLHEILNPIILILTFCDKI